MDLDAAFDAHLDTDEVRVTRRDVELLRAVREQGSLNGAAAALDRSYSRSQQRVVELEAALGQLVDRQRGGAGGGGSSLTATATDLLAEFDRVRAEFTGLTEVEETVLDGTVVERDGELGTVETDAGPVRAMVPAATDRVRLSVREDAVTLHPAGSVPETETSARNRFRGTVGDIAVGDAVARVTVDIGADIAVGALVTQTSVETLALERGDPIAVSFKATATRAFPDESS
ncbi:TOBE domain-containing protein [Halomicroarcula sp. GCM10025709]|uniref:TOBE domain-containing protein n=1 Tax=Haloarcula TaxID=2237 RepID=UPI0024C33B96|nr:TOBE domain-containing protein [Halomicroarcula sp. YJ-61-S]